MIRCRVAHCTGDGRAPIVPQTHDERLRGGIFRGRDDDLHVLDAHREVAVIYNLIGEHVSVIACGI